MLPKTGDSQIDEGTEIATMGKPTAKISFKRDVAKCIGVIFCLKAKIGSRTNKTKECFNF